MARIKYPRAVVTPFPRGQTMGSPGDTATQLRVLEAALELFGTAGQGEMRKFE